MWRIGNEYSKKIDCKYIVRVYCRMNLTRLLRWQQFHSIDIQVACINNCDANIYVYSLNAAHTFAHRHTDTINWINFRVINQCGLQQAKPDAMTINYNCPHKTNRTFNDICDIEPPTQWNLHEICYHYHFVLLSSECVSILINSKYKKFCFFFGFSFIT